MNGATICAIGSVYGFVAELRPWMPVDIGCVMWLAPQWPDIQSFIPLYAGVTGFPSAYCRPGYLNTLADHYNPPADIHERNSHHAFWAYVEFSELMNDNYGKYIESVRKNNLKPERKMLAMQPSIEKKLISIYDKSPDQARATVTSLYESLSMKALAATRKYIRKLK
jgi:dipeptidase